MAEDRDVTLAGARLRVRAETPEQARFWAGLAGGWEAETLAFVAAHARPGAAFVDVGAWIGPVSLTAARLGARVIALEPDPVARRALEANLALNGLRAQVIPAALHVDGGGLTLFGGGRGLGASTTSALGASRRDPIHVPTVTPEDVAARAGPGPAAVKVDVEGHEYALGPALTRLRGLLGEEARAGGAVAGGVVGGAAMHLSLHPRLLAKRLRRDWVIFARRRAEARTRALLAQFAPAPIRLSGEDGSLDEVRLARVLAGGRNFSVEIG